MIVSLFFLAAAADSIAHALRRLVRAITIGLRPASVLLASTLVLGTLCYWMWRGAESASEQLGRNIEDEAPISARSEGLAE